MASAISNVTNGNCHDSSSSIRWDGEKLSLGAGIAKLGDDTWKKEREGIERHVTTHVNEHPDVGLVVLERSIDVLHAELFMFCGRLLVEFEPANDPCTILLREERGIIRKVMNSPERQNGKEHGAKTLQDEDPSPSWFLANEVEVFNGRSKQASKGAGEGCSTEEYCCSDAKLLSTIPTRKVIVDAREETSLKETKEPLSQVSASIRRRCT